MKKQSIPPIKTLIKEHLDLRLATGRQSESNGYVLKMFSDFLSKNYSKLILPNRMCILDFLNSKNLQKSVRRNYFSHIRQFCLYLNQRGLKCYIPDKTLIPKYEYKIRYYPMTEDIIKTLMIRSRDFRPNCPIVGETYASIIGLLWCTGMRRKEVINLNHQDIDFKNNVILIRETKFRKSRFIPLLNSTGQALKNYSEYKEAWGYEIKNEDPFFINENGNRVVGHTLHTMFNRMVKKMDLKGTGGRFPCLHDLRHNFATQSLKRICSDSDKYPQQVYMPVLSTYLGHVDIMFSQHYLHPDFDLMVQASEKFNKIRKV